MEWDFGESKQKFLYISEPQNDFIFSIVAEELGFIGCFIIIALFAVLIWRGILIAMKSPDMFGSLVAIPIGYLCTYLPVYGKWSVFALIFLAGIYAAERYSNITGIEDPGSVVIDEVAGLLLFYIIFPFKPVYIIAGFILFRFFDILKPFPVSFFESSINNETISCLLSLTIRIISGDTP